MAILEIEITNEWLKRNKEVIEKMKKDCIEYSMSGNYGGGVNLEKIVRIIDSSMIELEVASKKCIAMEKEINELKQKLNDNKIIPLTDITSEN
jgi:predicted transcriptional regulator